MVEHVIKSYIYVNTDYGFQEHIYIPFEDSIEELVHIIIIRHNLPLYIENGLLNAKHINTLSSICML